MNRRNSLRRPLRLESLERRELMAGNVTASITDGQLTLTGNYQDNVLVLYRGENPGEVVVAGAKDSAGGNTLVNGGAAPVTLSSVTSIRADLRGGNDRMLVTNLTLPVDQDSQHRAIYAEMGEGNDQVVLSGNTGTPRAFALNEGQAVPYGPVNIAGSILVLGRAGNDTVNSVNAAVGRTIFYGHEGNDALSVDGAVAQNRIGSILFNLGTGNDTVSLKRAEIGSVEVGRYGQTGGNSRVDFFKVNVQAVDLRLSGSLQSQVTFDTEVGKN